MANPLSPALIYVAQSCAAFACSVHATAQTDDIDAAAPARDEVAQEQAAGDAPVVEGAGDSQTYPPEFVEGIDAEYPEAARLARTEGHVVLRLDINAEGAVTAVEVVGSEATVFDEAARDAAFKSRYKPARRGETPMASRILTRIDFVLPATPPAPPATPSLDKSALAVGLSADAQHEQEVTVYGTSEADQLRQSAEAVTVFETEKAKRESADMGELLARMSGIGVRRLGGLGSQTSFSLNGLTDEQVRFFIDGIPLELAGYPFGVANVPVNFADRIEVYSGVVPVRFGADALGGAVNFATDDDIGGTHGNASYEIGSFDTHRVSLGLHHLDEPTGFFIRSNGFFDYALNDYAVNVEVSDDEGQLSPARVYRFHDKFRSSGGNVELGLVKKPWAQRLSVRGFVTNYDKEFQHNIVMTIPYGEVTYGEFSAGGSARYQQTFKHGLSTDITTGYAYTRGEFIDVAECVYDWFGRCGRTRRVAGETDDRPLDQVYWDHSPFARANLVWLVHEAHTLRLNLAPTYFTRTGDERRQLDPEARDPLNADRKLLTLVNGVEYELDVLDDRLENIAFAKQYVQVLKSEEPRPGGFYRERDRGTLRFGVGDGLRYRFLGSLYGKVSYEWATRLPRAEEMFGDNVFVAANLELQPETSHNANLSLTLDDKETKIGQFRAAFNGFWREAKELIVLLGNDRVQSYQNVYGARSVGVEGALGWTSTGEYLVIDGNATYQDFRNTSGKGTFGDFEGDRIPNRPYLFANGSARVQFKNVIAKGDEVSLIFHTRYVHEYFRGWESIGLREFKQTIDAQLIHTAAVSYFVESDAAKLSSTIEVQNLTDAKVYDFFGVQRPGRAFYAKFTGSF